VPKRVCRHGLPRRWSPEVKDAAVVRGGASLGLGWRRIGFWFDLGEEESSRCSCCFVGKETEESGEASDRGGNFPWRHLKLLRVRN
jgi:hypothetical protein